MKTLLVTLLGIGLATTLPAQLPEDPPPSIRLTASELDELFGPVALYPDALISLILPASTAPLDIVMAARFVASGEDLARIDEKPWDLSVRALTRYPETLRWLDENLDWTAQVGNAFIEQPVDVMESIQRLRSRARELGNLVDTPQQRIVQDETYIRIIPAQVDYIYEPRYDPEVIYYERPVAEPYLYFSLGFGVGSWLNHDCDWRRHRVYRGDWHEGWDYRRDSDRYRRDGQDNIYINNNFTNVQEWRPDAVRYRTQSRSVAERIYTDRNSVSRTPSRDPVTNELRTADGKSSAVESRVTSNDLSVKESRKRHAGIVRPKPIAGAPNHADGVKRNALSERTAAGAEPSARKMQESRTETDPKDRVVKPNSTEMDSKGRVAKPNSTEADSKGRIAKPNSVAPGMPDDGRGKNKNNGRDDDDRKKSAVEPLTVTPRIESPSKKEGEGRARTDVPESKREDTPKRKEVPVNEETRRTQDMQKRQETPKEEASKKTEAPKREEVRKPQETPKRQEVARQEAPRKAETPKREEPKREQVQKKQDTPKRQEVIRQQEAPKRVEAPKQQEAPKKEVTRPSSEPAKAKGRSSKEDEEEKSRKKR